MRIHVTSSSLQKQETILLEKYTYKRLEEKVNKLFPKKKVMLSVTDPITSD
jgi:hypothetical protein